MAVAEALQKPALPFPIEGRQLWEHEQRRRQARLMGAPPDEAPIDAHGSTGHAYIHCSYAQNDPTARPINLLKKNSFFMILQRGPLDKGRPSRADPFRASTEPPSTPPY